MSEAAEKASLDESNPARAVCGTGEEFLSIGTHDGDMNAGSLNDWLVAMRSFQSQQKEQATWICVLQFLTEASQAWLRLNESWAREIAVSICENPKTLSFYVVPKEGVSVDIEKRRVVADLGLTFGGCLGIRSEARLSSLRPSEHHFLIDLRHADQH